MSKVYILTLKNSQPAAGGRQVTEKQLHVMAAVIDSIFNALL